MKTQTTLTREFVKGLWDQNPIARQILGTCPTLAVTVSAMNGIAMALATTFVLVFSSLIISLVRSLIPSQVRIAAYIVIIATFVTIADLVLRAQFPDLSKSLGPYVPLIVVNCIILGRAEAFASKNGALRSTLDALGMGAGFLIVLVVLGSIREMLGSRTVFGMQVLPDMFEPWLIMILPAGAFVTFGLLLGAANTFTMRPSHRSALGRAARRRGGDGMNLILIFLSAAVVNNFVLAYFLGICPFIGVSNKLSSAVSMGLATTFVMVLTAIVSWLIYHLVLVPFGLDYLQYVSFILVIAALVQFVEMFIKKVSRPLYRALGIFLPLITTNCAILGLALFLVLRNYDFLESIFFGVGAGAGFTLALAIMAGIREELDLADIPAPFRGAPITLVVAGLLALAFMGFAGLITS